MATSKASASALLTRLRKALWRLTSHPAPITSHDDIYIIVLDKKGAEETAMAIEHLVAFVETFSKLKDSS